MADYIPTDEDMATMEQAARKFQGAWTGASGHTAGFVILLLGELRRVRVEWERLRVEAAMKEKAPPISYD